MKKYALFVTVSILLALAVLCGTAWGEEPEFKPHLSLRILGGLGYQNQHDLNSGSEGMSGIIIMIGGGGALSGSYGPVHFGLDLGADLIYEFSPNWGVGIGTGFLKTSRSSSLVFTNERFPFNVTETFTIEPEAIVVPIRAALFLFVPVGRNFRITLNAGPELYLASVSSHIRTDYPDWWWDQQEKASGDGFGFHMGIGLEARVSSMISLVVEAQGRYAKVDGLTGSHRLINSQGYQETAVGTFYYWADSTHGTYRLPHMTFPLVAVQSSFPSGPYSGDAREAVLDLSGGSLVAGFVFRF